MKRGFLIYGKPIYEYTEGLAFRPDAKPRHGEMASEEKEQPRWGGEFFEEAQ